MVLTAAHTAEELIPPETGGGPGWEPKRLSQTEACQTAASGSASEAGVLQAGEGPGRSNSKGEAGLSREGLPQS